MYSIIGDTKLWCWNCHNDKFYATTVEQRMSKNSVPLHAMVGSWCLPRSVAPVTIASSFSIGYVAEIK